MKWKKQKESRSNSLPHDINMVPSFGISLKIIISFTVISASAIPITESTLLHNVRFPLLNRPHLQDMLFSKTPMMTRKKMPCCRLTWHQKLANPLTVCKPIAIPEDIQLSREGEGISYLIMKFRMNCKSETSPIPFAIKFQKYWWKMSVLLVQKLLPFLPCPPGDHQGIEQRQKVT